MNTVLPRSIFIPDILPTKKHLMICYCSNIGNVLPHVPAASPNTCR